MYKKGKIVIITNMKGGIGKTTDNDLLSVVGSQVFHKKILLIDYDQQRNSTSNMTSTFKITDYKSSLAAAVESGDWLDSVTRLSENLDFIAGSLSARDLVGWLDKKYPKGHQRDFAFKDQFDLLRQNYDYIFIDCPPSTDDIVQSFITTCDFIIPLQELKRFAMEGTDAFLNEILIPIYDAYQSDVHFQIIGILPVLFTSRLKSQQKNLNLLYDKYDKSNVFSTIIKGSDRMELYGENGIQLDDHWDQRMWSVFCDIFCELERRIQFYELNQDIEGFSYTPIYANPSSQKVLPKGKEIELNGIITD